MTPSAGTWRWRAPLTPRGDARHCHLCDIASHEQETALTIEEEKELLMRKTLFWIGWAVLFVLPVIIGVQIYLTQDLPDVTLWKLLIPFGAIVVIFFSRNRDDVLKHHLA